MRIGQLDSLRGLFALLVVAYHTPVAHSFMNAPIVRNGSVGVNFFFILSGFVIMLAYGSRIASWRGAVDFTIARVGRLWPLHIFAILVLTVYMLTRWAMDHYGIYPFNDGRMPDMILWEVVRQSLMLHAFANDTANEINPVSWSIAVEFWCYLLFAAVALIGSRRIAILAVMSALALAFATLAGAVEMPFGNARAGLWRALFYFTIGVVAYRVFEHAHRRGIAVGTPVELLAVVGFMLLVHFWQDLPMQELWGAFVFAPGMVLLALGRGAVTRGLNLRFFRMLGDRSYSIYMIHMIVLLGIGTLTRLAERVAEISLTGVRPWPGGEIDALTYGSTMAANLAFVAILALVVMLSGWTYRNVELPGQQAAKTWIRGRRQTGVLSDTREERAV